MKILLTGKPGIGKTTLLDNFISEYSGRKVGFTTKRIKDSAGVNWGFEVETLYHVKRVLAHKTQINSRFIVGNGHHVDISTIDEFILPTLIKANRDHDLIIIDEIGRMEALSPKFLQTVSNILNEKCSVLATIVLEDEEWSIPFKRNKEVLLIEINEQNRDKLAEVLVQIYSENDNYEKLTESQKAEFRQMLGDYIRLGDWTHLKKLYTNALVYLCNNQINKGGDSVYVVSGNHGDHQVYMNDSTFECDCDLFRGIGSYSGWGGDCSHIQTVKLFIS